MTWSAFGQTLPQAVGIAISPIPMVLVILMLVSARARTNGPAFAVGWTVGLVGVASLAYALSDGADMSTDADASDAGSGVQVLLGLLFLFLAARAWRNRPRPGDEPSTPKLFGAVDTMSALKSLGLGFAGAAANPKNLPLAISAGVSISQAGATGVSGVAAVLLFGIVASTTVLVPVIGVLVLGDRTRQPLDALKVWLLANNSTIMMVLFIVLGAKMLGSGLALTS